MWTYDFLKIKCSVNKRGPRVCAQQPPFSPAAVRSSPAGQRLLTPSPSVVWGISAFKCPIMEAVLDTQTPGPRGAKQEEKGQVVPAFCATGPALRPPT